MRRPGPEGVIGEWGVGYESPREEREREALERYLADNPARGEPIRPRLRGAPSSSDSYVASLGGPLPYMQRLRQVEEELSEHERRLEETWRRLARECLGDAGAFHRRWTGVASRWVFLSVNELIERHNRYYPAEARLPMDPRTGDFALVGGKPYWKEPLDARWVLERYPSDLDEALGYDAAA
ncbi:MAG: hypothetical protein H0T39_04520 [Actinobacteria bacterium]|nr:hypothetical protein [Actinomycetota bacterium]